MPVVALDDLIAPITSTPLKAPGGDPIGTATSLAVLGHRVYIADLFQAVVEVLDRSTGVLVRKLGRPGDGAGELGRPVVVEVDTLTGSARLLILDRTRQGITILDTLGAFLAQVRVPGSWTTMTGHGARGMVIVGGVASATNDAAAQASTKMDIVHEVDLTTGESRASYYRFTPPSRLYEEVFNNPAVAAGTNIVVAGAFNTNRLYIRARGTGEDHYSDIGAPWYRPIEWPTAETPLPGTSLPDKVNRWSRRQQMLVRLFVGASDAIVAQFRWADESGEATYAYILADERGAPVRATSFSRFQLLRMSGDTAFGVVADTATGTSP
ncbi:MAG: hypothetical protein IPK85_04530 [Gemmatimonadetes bacterium]|nr:hypothetical protein [Gemmatimonadota bacterium]